MEKPVSPADQKNCSLPTSPELFQLVASRKPTRAASNTGTGGALSGSDAFNDENARSDICGLIERFPMREATHRLANRREFQVGFDPTNDGQEFLNFLRGAKVGRAVVQLHVADTGSFGRIGSALLVGGGLVLTWAQTVVSIDDLWKTTLTFDHQVGKDVGLTKGGHFSVSTKLFLRSEALGYTILQMQQTPGNPFLNCPTYVDLWPLSGKALKGELVHIFHYPVGGSKMVQFARNRVLGRKDSRIYFSSDGLGVEPGAPIFNKHWQAVAMQIATFSDPADPTRNLCNIGVRVSSIVDDIAARKERGCPSANEIDDILSGLRQNGGQFRENPPRSDDSGDFDDWV